MNAERQVFIVDDDARVRESLGLLLQSAGLEVQGFASAEDFLGAYSPGNGCLIVDISMPSMSGLELQQEIVRAGLSFPVIVITGHGDVQLAVKAMKAGAVDFIEKPFDGETLLAGVERALTIGRQLRDRAEEMRAARKALAALTARERDVLERLVRGRPNKVVAYELGISPRTVEIHRARIMSKLRAKSLSDLVRLTIAADESKNTATLDRTPVAASPRT
jgi:two-component system response regulator FixJ